MNNKKTFMFLYKNMNIGGIETYLIRLIRKLRAQGNRIIWLTTKDREIDAGFMPDLLDGNVEIVEINTDKLYWIKHTEINFSSDEEILALAFDPINFLRLESLKQKYNNRIDTVYWVPHFKGPDCFIEEFLKWPFSFYIKKITSKIIKSMEENNNIYYLNESHARAYSERYNYQIENLEGKVMKGISIDLEPYDKELALFRSKREAFNIISVGRFEFPHKSYILGLIRAYGQLKKKYKNLSLTIIGYGEGENKVKEEVRNLSDEAKKDINIIGKVNYDDLGKYFKVANLNIGVAGALLDGAVTGLISIPVRHYSEECEAYGFLPEVKDKITSSESGFPIQEFIEKVIMMDQTTYLNLSKETYLSYTNYNEDILSILEFKNKDCKVTIDKKKIRYIKQYVNLIKLKIKISSWVKWN